MPNIGGPELILVLAVVLIVFGAGKLPDVLGQLDQLDELVRRVRRPTLRL